MQHGDMEHRSDQMCPISGIFLLKEDRNFSLPLRSDSKTLNFVLYMYFGLQINKHIRVIVFYPLQEVIHEPTLLGFMMNNLLVNGF